MNECCTQQHLQSTHSAQQLVPPHVYISKLQCVTLMGELAALYRERRAWLTLVNNICLQNAVMSPKENLFIMAILY